MALSELGKTWYDPNLVLNIIEPYDAIAESRYTLKTQMRLANQDVVIRNLRVSDIYIAQSPADTMHRIEAKEQYRPDLVAFQQYNNPNMAWVLLAANNMKSIFDFTTDKIIRIPEVTTLYSSGGVLSK